MNARGFVAAIAAGLLLDGALPCAGARGEADARDSASTRDLIEVSRDLLTVRVESSPLQSVLDVIARASGVSIRVHATFGETVTTDLRGLPVDEGLRRILGSRSAVFVYRGDLAGTHDPELVEVHVYPGSALGSAAVPPVQPRPAVAWRQPTDSVGDVESGSGTDGVLARASRGGEDRPVPARSAGVTGLLNQALGHEQDPSARVRAARALGRIGGDEAVAPLAASIATDPDPAVREAAAWGLGKTWSDGAVTPLARALLEDQPLFVRQAAAQALGETWSEAAVDALALAVSVDARRSVRETAAEALGKIGSPKAVEALVAALGDAHSTVRESAAAALGAIGSREALGVLIQISLTDRDHWVRRSAEGAAAKILGAD